MKLAKLEPQNALVPLATGAAAADLKRIGAAIDAALSARDHATRLALEAGQLLNEIQERLEWGQFQPWIEKYFPQISYETANRWARAAANIVKHLPAPTIDIPVSIILTGPESSLPPDARRYRQAWLDFTSDKTIKDCLGDVVVGGDDAHRVDRALNGKFKGGTNAHDDRKDFPLFSGQLLQKLSGHIAHWQNMTTTQRSEIGQLLRDAIGGHSASLARKTKPGFPFKQPWPEELCKLMIAACRQRIKGGANE